MSYVSRNGNPEKIPYIFSNKKAFSIFQEMKPSYISGNEHPKKLHIFHEIAFGAQKKKKTFSEKVSYISGGRLERLKIKTFSYRSV